MNNQILYDLIPEYINGQLDKDVIKSFEKHLDQNPDLAAEVEFQKEVAKVTSLHSVFDEAENEIKMTSSSARVFRIKRLVMAASILILIAVTPLSYGYVNYNNEALAHIGYKKIELTAQNSYRGQKDVKTDFELGERAFMEERFKEGVDYFERINKGDSRYANAQFNVALGKYNLQQFESAVNAIKISLSSSPSIVLKQRAEWLLILAEINLGIESNDLFDRLRQIGQDDGHLFQNEAQILNKKLNSPFRLIFK